jgi:hypothetical protein
VRSKRNATNDLKTVFVELLLGAKRRSSEALKKLVVFIRLFIKFFFLGHIIKYNGWSTHATRRLWRTGYLPYG